jgi:uncharacterized membrane protein
MNPTKSLPTMTQKTKDWAKRKTILSGTSSSIRTKLWWNSHWMFLLKLCLAVALSHQDGCHSAVAVLLKAGLIQVSDYMLLGASGCYTVLLVQSDTWVFRHATKIDGPNVFLLTNVKLEYSNILYNPTHFHGPLVCRIRQVPLCCVFIPL